MSLRIGRCALLGASLSGEGMIEALLALFYRRYRARSSLVRSPLETYGVRPELPILQYKQHQSAKQQGQCKEQLAAPFRRRDRLDGIEIDLWLVVKHGFGYLDQALSRA